MNRGFDEAFRLRLRDLFVWRRDVRRFRRDPLPAGALERLIEVACLSPSVGLSQPWRFVVVDDSVRRGAVRANFKACNAAALKSYSGELAARYAALKLAGLEEAPAIWRYLPTMRPKRDTAWGEGRCRKWPTTRSWGRSL